MGGIGNGSLGTLTCWVEIGENEKFKKKVYSVMPDKETVQTRGVKQNFDR